MNIKTAKRIAISKTKELKNLGYKINGIRFIDSNGKLVTSGLLIDPDIEQEYILEYSDEIEEIVHEELVSRSLPEENGNTFAIKKRLLSPNFDWDIVPYKGKWNLKGEQIILYPTGKFVLHLKNGEEILGQISETFEQWQKRKGLNPFSSSRSKSKDKIASKKSDYDHMSYKQLLKEKGKLLDIIENNPVDAEEEWGGWAHWREHEDLEIIDRLIREKKINK